MPVVLHLELEARQKVEKDLDLFSRLSHEIRTPVTIISGFADLMRDWTLPTDQRCVVSDLASAARRLTAVANDLLSFTNRFEDQESMIEFNLRNVVDTVIEYHLAELEASKSNLYIDIPANLPIEVAGSKTRLVGILDHLVHNAIKFTRMGSVTIQVRLDNQAVIPGTVCEFEIVVRDTGVGMTCDELAEIFEPFFQSRPGVTNEFGGVGLGLAQRRRSKTKHFVSA